MPRSWLRHVKTINFGAHTRWLQGTSRNGHHLNTPNVGWECKARVTHATKKVTKTTSLSTMCCTRQGVTESITQSRLFLFGCSVNFGSFIRRGLNVAIQVHFQRRFRNIKRNGKRQCSRIQQSYALHELRPPYCVLEKTGHTHTVLRGMDEIAHDSLIVDKQYRCIIIICKQGAVRGIWHKL